LVLGCLLGAAAPCAAASAEIQPGHLPRIGAVDERFQSYNVEMAEIIGGDFWRPYEPDGKVERQPAAPGKHATGGDSNLFQAVQPLDTANPRLRKLAAALGPAYVRISGTWANSIYFHDSDAPPPASAPPGFKGVLTRSEWKGAIDFARAANAELVSSFAVSTGVRDRNGVWTADQAATWLAYTKAAGGRIAAAEFFNEPTLPALGGAPSGYDAAAYARDFAIFRSFVKRLAPHMAIVGPGAVGEAAVNGGDGQSGMIATEDLLAARPRPVFDIYSYHHYPALSIRCASLGPQTQTTADVALSEDWLALADKSNAFHVGLRDRYAPGAPVWITEIADAACGGNPWAKTFLDSFRYADTLGRLARRGVAVLFHNTLAASDYGLLQPGTFEPRPNYWAALLWRRLMGPTVLDAGLPREGLHLYAHCLRGHRGGVALLAINNSRTMDSDAELSVPSERYTLAAASLQSEQVALNGKPLLLGANDELPLMEGGFQPPGPVNFAPTTITFLAVPNAENPQCQ
jgi:heparanase